MGVFKAGKWWRMVVSECVNVCELKDQLCNWSDKRNQTAFISCFQWLEVESPFVLSSIFCSEKCRIVSESLRVERDIHIDLYAVITVYDTYNYLVKGHDLLKRPLNWYEAPFNCPVHCAMSNFKQIYVDLLSRLLLPTDKILLKTLVICGGRWRQFYFSFWNK